MLSSAPVLEGKTNEMDKVTRVLAVSATVVFEVQLAMDAVVTDGEIPFIGIVAADQITFCAVGEYNKLIAETPLTFKMD